MLRKLILVALLAGIASRGQAQNGIYVRSEGDTLRYSYTPLSQEEAARCVLPEELAGQAPETAAAEQPAKKNFLHRFVEYFEKANTDRTFEKKIDFTFAGGPSYSKNTSLGLGVLAAGLYRIDRTDSVTQPSNISIFANASLSGFYALGVSGYTIWDHNRQRVNYTAMFSSAPCDFWGIGYDAGHDSPKTSYVRKLYRVEGVYLHQVLPGTYLGARVDFRYTRGKDFEQQADAYLRARGQRADYTATGIGLVAEYDTRDVISSPQRGAYLSLQTTWYPKPLGSCDKSLWRTTVTADWYHALWRGGTVATDLYAEFNTNGTPWPLLAQLGGSYRMRGYYEGQYMDNDMITFQVELRQRIWRRIGCAIWGGAGNVFPEMERFSWKETLPNYGIGLRWELKKRVNVRIDCGFGENTSGFLLNVNEAF